MTDQEKRILDAAMGLAAERGWRDLTLADMARAAEVTLAELHAAFPGKGALLSGIGRVADEVMLAGDGGDAEETPRDRLFDVVMRRFDALLPYRDAIRRIRSELRGDPSSVLTVLCRMNRSMSLTLEAAGISSSGLRGLARTQVLAAIYGRTFRTWLDDDSPDMAPTMAELDGQLRRAEGLAQRFGRPAAGSDRDRV